MMKYSEFFFGEKIINVLNMQHVSFYKKKFNYPNLLEIDTRFLVQKISNVFTMLNFLNDFVDYIGLYDKL